MAYDPDVPPSLITQDISGSEGMRFYALYWTDPIATVLGAGYIENAVELGMRVGDGFLYKDTNMGEWSEYSLVVLEIDEATGAATLAFPEVPEEAVPLLDVPVDETFYMMGFQGGRQVKALFDGIVNDAVQDAIDAAIDTSIGDAIDAAIAAAFAGRIVRTFADYSITAALPDCSTAINAAFADCANDGAILLGGAGTFQCGSDLIVPANLHFIGGPGCRLEKNYTSTGSDALLRPSDVAVGVDNVIIRDVELGAVSHEIAAVPTNKIMWASGSRWRLENIKVSTWSGWGITLGGNDMSATNITFEDPLGTGGDEAAGLGTDGLHVAYGSGIRIKGVFGVAGDDFIAVATPLTGVVADQDIYDVVVEDVSGESLAARFIMVGIWNATLTSTVKRVAFRNVHGKAASALGAILVTSIATPGEVEDITFDGFSVDCIELPADSSGVHVRCPSGGATNVAFKNGRTYNAAADSLGFRTLGYFDGLNVENCVFDNTGSADDCFSVDNPEEAQRLFTRNVVLICGTGGGYTGPAAAVALNDSDCEFDIREIGDGARGFTTSACSDSRFKLKLSPKAGATTAIGLREQASATRNIFEDGDFSAMSGFGTVVELAQTDSIYRNNVGYITKSKGTATVLNTTTTVAVAHGLARTPRAVNVRPTNDLGAAAQWWVNGVGATTFDINVDVDPGAPTATFAWEATAEDVL